MAILDSFALLAGTISGGVITPESVIGTGNIASTNVYDTQAGLTINTGGQSVDLGTGDDFDIEIDIPTAFVGCTSVEFQFCSSTDTALSVSVLELGSTGPIPVANLTAGTRLNLSVPKAAGRAVQRYVGMRFVVVGTSTAGAVSAAFTHDAGEFPAVYYKAGYTVV